jgi:DNA-binding MarR family transcriptional regulator
MTEDANPFGDIVLPGLLRAARNVYAAAVRAALFEAGFEDIPRNGVYVLGSIARSGAPLGRIIRELAVSKQAAGQLLDTLALRGYIERAIDPEDRRRLTITLTERGAAAAAASRAAVERIDAEIVRRVSDDSIRQTIATLIAVIEFGEEARPNDGDA